MQEIGNVAKMQEIGNVVKMQEETRTERPLRPYMRPSELLKEETRIERPLRPFMRTSVLLKEEKRIERPLRPYETRIERPLLPYETRIERPLRPFMRPSELLKEETRIERPLRPYETRIERPLRPFMTTSVLLKEMRPSELLKEMRPSELLKEETRIERPLRPYMRPSELLIEMIDLNQRKQRMIDLNQRKRMKNLKVLQELADLREEIAILIADKSEVKMIFGKQEVHISNRRSCHGTKLLKSSITLAPFFFTCAGGTGHGSDQTEHQDHSEIYPSTLNDVSNCPSLGEYMQRSLAKCADVCRSYMQDGDCAYHCMRDSSKTKLVEFCAKPKPLFDFCPEYDPVDQTIQKDLGTLCNSTFSRNYYNSSDIYFCDPNNCLQLRESSVRSGATTLTTLINETTEMNGGDNQEWFLPLTVVLAALILAITIGCILVFSARIRKMTNERNQDGRPYLTNDELM